MRCMLALEPTDRAWLSSEQEGRFPPGTVESVDVSSPDVASLLRLLFRVVVWFFVHRSLSRLRSNVEDARTKSCLLCRV